MSAQGGGGRGQAEHGHNPGVFGGTGTQGSQLPGAHFPKRRGALFAGAPWLRRVQLRPLRMVSAVGDPAATFTCGNSSSEIPTTSRFSAFAARMLVPNAFSLMACEGRDGRVPRRVWVTDIRKVFAKDPSIRFELCVCMNIFKLEIQVLLVHLSGDG